MQQFYDVIVIGAGHAGCEAAHAAARLGAHVCLVTMDMNKIAQMSCNPAVGGIAKGQIVREIDALGGGMGIITDASAIQFRMLNKSKGPAMWSPRAQCDRGKFIWNWRTLLDNTPNLDIWQDQVTELLVEAQSEELRVKSEKFGNDLSNKADSSSIATNKSNSNSSLFTLQSSLNQPRQRVVGCKTIWGCELIAPAVVVTAGTFLNGLMHVGRKMVPGGRCAEPAALHLTESLNALGITSQRMKTGTPVRIDKRSVHFEDTEIQPGENVAQLFSYLHRDNFAKEGLTSVAGTAGTTGNAGNAGISGLSGLPGTSGTTVPLLPQLPCWTFNTNEECHKELLKGLEDSPLYNGQIQSIGPRYCPSVETKLVTFPDRTQHPLFLEPEGTDTNEMYLNGFSSSMPMDVQINALKKIPALRDIRIYRPGYAIEYDFFDPTQLDHSLMNKQHPGLFFAGQVNGTTGYEEAGGQGIVAGINAARYAGSLGSDVAFDPFVLNRDEAYIGVLIDDLVMKGVDEPYRMFTSRAEYRILLRQDDADTRLTPRSYDLGLASTQRYDLWKKKRDGIESIKSYALSTNVSPKDANAYLESIGSTPLQHGCKLSELIARPGVTISGLSEVLPSFKETIAAAGGINNSEIADCAEIEVKYDGYIRRERETAEKMHRLENIKISGHFDYNSIQGLSTEARQKLTARKPETLAQASRIPGISPADINVLLVLMGR